VIAVPFDPDEVWGAKAGHPVGGTIDGSQVGGIIAPGGRGWALTLTPMWLCDAAVTAGDDVTIELGPEGPHRGDLADDISAALEANPRAAAFVAMGKLSRTVRSGRLLGRCSDRSYCPTAVLP
jgi:hypothetical protein